MILSSAKLFARIRTAVLVFFLTVSLSGTFFSEPVYAQPAPQDDIDFITPEQNIDGLGVSFTTDEALLKQGVTDQDGQLFIQIPFLGEYLAGLYRYAVGISGAVAVIMIVVAGFQWATSGGSPDVIGAAKERIVNAVTGLLLVLCSYALLYAINPELVQFRSLSIPYIGENYEFEIPDPPLDEQVASSRRVTGQTTPSKTTASAIAQEGHNGAMRTIQRVQNLGGSVLDGVDPTKCPLTNTEFVGNDGTPQDTYSDSLLQKYAFCTHSDYRLLKAFAETESRLNPRARNSRSGFTGLFQTKSKNCEDALKSFSGGSLTRYCSQGTLLSGSKPNSPVWSSLLNAEISTMVGSAMLYRSGQKILRKFNDCTPQDFTYLAYLGHHSGPGALDAVLSRLPTCAQTQQLACRFNYEYYQTFARGKYHDNTPPACAQ